MNYTDYADYYKAEVAYRREQVRRDWAPIRTWRRSRTAASATAPKNRTR